MPAGFAWVIDFSGGIRAAIGELDLAHVLSDEPASFEVPGRPRHCQRVIRWENRVVPVFDVSAYLGVEQRHAAVPPYYAIVRYRPQAGVRAVVGSLIMERIPYRLAVDDEFACELPRTMNRWRPIALSCFSEDGRPVPVIDIGGLFQVPLTAAA